VDGAGALLVREKGDENLRYFLKIDKRGKGSFYMLWVDKVASFRQNKFFCLTEPAGTSVWLKKVRGWWRFSQFVELYVRFTMKAT
jgi:hypothetical protein